MHLWLCKFCVYNSSSNLVMIFWKLSLTRVLWVSWLSCPVLLGVGTLRASLLNLFCGDLGVPTTMRHRALCQ